jgi:type VI secretion system secreted protein VgrG
VNSLFSTNMQFTQDNRPIRIETALGKDTLLLRRFRGTESFSQLFRFEADLLSYEENINPTDIIGEHVAVFIDANGDQARCLNGFVKSFIYTGLERRGLYGYKAEIVPWLWFLDKRTNCRVYQNQTVQQIIEAVFTDLGFSDYTFSLSEEHPELEYCVQYQE